MKTLQEYKDQAKELDLLCHLHADTDLEEEYLAQLHDIEDQISTMLDEPPDPFPFLTPEEVLELEWKAKRAAGDLVSAQSMCVTIEQYHANHAYGVPRTPKTPWKCSWSESRQTLWRVNADEPRMSWGEGLNYYTGLGRTPERALKHLLLRMKHPRSGNREYAAWMKYGI